MSAGGLVQAMFPSDDSAVNTAFVRRHQYCPRRLHGEEQGQSHRTNWHQSGLYYTGASVNPARSFGPAVASTVFPTSHWIYWVRPFMGVAIAAGYYRFMKHFNYEQANLGQDDSGAEFHSA
ncbi:hypothetical protein ACN47E_004847 [Coniothyrium glycines]